MKIEAGASVTPNVRLLRLLGEGGMGAVWAAEHLALGTEVAVKFLLGEFAQNEAARARFSREAAAASQVKSAHVVKIYDYGITDGDVPFIVMEMLDGADLAERIVVEKKLPPSEVVTIVTQLCKALERAHEKGVIHRDIKPENVVLGREGGDLFVKLLDFGIAKTAMGKLSPSHRSTMAGESLGTPYYMSPEQFRSAREIDARSDLWSVGVLAYEALTGRLPFEGDTVGALAIVVNDAKAAPPSTIDPSLPPALDAWFAKACARDPADRFASPRELAAGLRAAFGESSDASSSMRRVVISQIDDALPANAESLSLRETAFATSGGQAKPSRRNALPWLASGALLVIAAGVAVWATHKPAAIVSTRPDVGATTSSVVRDAPKPPALATSAAAETASVTTAATATAAPTHSAHQQAPRPRPSASSAVAPTTSSQAHGDIW